MTQTRHDHLFVYGTLTTTAGHPLGDVLRAGAVPAGRGSIRAKLYIIDDPDEPGQNFYPGAVPSGDPADRVWGEVYRLTDRDTVLAALDRFEACGPDHEEPHEFILRSVAVEMENGTTLRAHCYLYSWDLSTARPVPSGRYEEAAAGVR